MTISTTQPYFIGYLCPVCLVRFPYAGKLAEHWTKFHYNRLKREEVKSHSSLGYLRKRPMNFQKRHSSVGASHNFQSQKINNHNPWICSTCHQITWISANICKDCGVVCHVQCQHSVVTRCRSTNIKEKMRSFGEHTRIEDIGDIRCESSIHIKRSSYRNSRCKSGHEDEENELEFTYITDRLVALTFPATGQETEYRKCLMQALSTLQKLHTDKFRIINVSERRYDILQMNNPGQVLDYGWPDHLAPPLQKIDQMINSIHCWLQAHPKNVAVIHCKGGRSRIALVIAAYIQFSKNLPSPQGALDWIALKGYYDSRLEGATHPSQRRYVRCYGDMYDGSLKIVNKPLLFRNLILHGVPRCEYPDSGLKFRVKFYQGYHLVYTSKTFFVPSGSDRYCVSFSEAVQLQGDVMVKCIQQGGISQNVIFRLQFHSDTLHGCVACFGKYDLDEAFQDSSYSESSYVELVFAPAHLNYDEQEDIFDRERQMDGHIAVVENNQTTYVAGPIDGNPYAQIDPHLKQKLRESSMDTLYKHQDTSLQRGIEDLDGILGDLGYTAASEPDLNANTYYPSANYSDSKNCGSINSVSSKETVHTLNIKEAPLVSENEIKVIQRGQLHEAPPQQQQCMRNVSTDSSGNNEVFSNSHSSVTAVNDLLYELDHSSLNSSLSGMRKTRGGSMTRNTSNYDNDVDEYEIENKQRSDSVDGEMEIKPGTVAQHIKSLNKVLFTEVSEYSKKYGVPMAGVNDASIVEQKVSAFNSRSVAPGFCSPPCQQIYHSQGALTRVDYQHRDEEDGRHNVFTYPTTGDEYSSKMTSLLTRSDSAYGESMRSSSPSPLATPTSSQQRVTSLETSNNNEQDDGGFINVDVTSNKQLDSTNSPRSDNNGKSSGIGSQTSSMNSLDCDEDSSLNSFNMGVTSKSTSTPSANSQATLNSSASIRIFSQPQQQQHHSPDLLKKHEPEHVHFAQSADYMQRHALQSADNTQHIVQNVDNIQPHTLQNVENTQRHAVQSKAISTPTNISSNQEKLSAKRTLTVVEEYIQPAHIQKEVESLNNDIFKNLLEEDFVGKPQESPASIPFHVSNTNDHVTSKSNELDIFQISSSQQMKEHSPGHVANHVTYDFEDKMTPGTPRRFPSMDSHPGHLGHPHAFTRTLSNGSSTTSDEPTSPRSPGSAPGSGRSTLRLRRYRSSGGDSTSSISSAELFPDVTRYPNIKFDKDTMNLWYRPNISRDEATMSLRDKQPGSFVVRASQSYEGAFGLAVKVETPPVGVLQQVGGDVSKIDLNNELVRHFLIEPCKKGVRLKGSNEEPTFPSLVALIYQHTLTKMALPVPLVIPEMDVVDGPRNGIMNEAQLLEKGAACNLVYLGAVKVDTLTGDGAVQYAMNKVTSLNITLKTTVINIKVNRTGITLTDNNRRVFFRKHFQMSDILHCGVDPKGRKVNLKTFIETVDREVGCFGFVVKKQANSPENHCHVFAEMELDQPASAVINFIHKAMRSSRV